MASSQLNPRTSSYEFLGPPGTAFITLSVPIFNYALYYGCSEEGGGCPGPPTTFPNITNPQWWAGLWDSQAAYLYLAWYTYCIVAWAVLPGQIVEGTLLRDGSKKKYKMNAFPTFVLAMALAVSLILVRGPQAFTVLYDKWVGLLTAGTIMAIVQAFLVYMFSFVDGKLLALGGNTGVFIYDFFMGRELNPSIGMFDLKSFNELRPGLILWALIDLSMLCAQFVHLGEVTDSMWLVCIFQILYVGDSIYNESAILTTMDITTDGFGFMLAIADFAFIPFTYSLQACYLVFTEVRWGVVKSGILLSMNLLGYYIFRVSNGEKNEFRNGRNPKQLTFMTTEKGSKLLTSGWWGRSRHPNYFGDLLMASAWCLATGFDTMITYYYLIFFTILLLHRQNRDDENCRLKHGKDWETYKKLVPSRIIPCVY